MHKSMTEKLNKNFLPERSFSQNSRCDTERKKLGILIYSPLIILVAIVKLIFCLCNVAEFNPKIASDDRQTPHVSLNIKKNFSSFLFGFWDRDS